MAVIFVCCIFKNSWIKTLQGLKVEMDKYFYRDFQLTSRDVTLDFSQYTVGDVGCVVWDAALVLAGYFDQLSKSRSLKNLKVLELGSGTGCVGLVLAALGFVISVHSFNFRALTLAEFNLFSISIEEMYYWQIYLKWCLWWKEMLLKIQLYYKEKYLLKHSSGDQIQVLWLQRDAAASISC